MKQRLVGKSGLRSSEIALGSMTFGDRRASGCDEAEAVRILDRFVEAGGTTIDTAPNYAEGRSEEIIGAFAADRRDQLVLSTKYTAAASTHPLAGGNSRRSMVQSVEGSLRRLRTDRIDLLWLHFWDGTTSTEEILRAADDLIRAGKILYFGLSDVPAWIAARLATMAGERRQAPVVALQMEYNVGSRGVERDLVPMAQAMDLAVFCWGPLAAGALAGGHDPRRMEERRIPAALQSVRKALAGIAAREQVSVRRLALRWLMQMGSATIPIVGARTLGQISDILGDVAEPLADDVLSEIDALASGGDLFPYPLIGSSYLHKFAFGDPGLFLDPDRPRC